MKIIIISYYMHIHIDVDVDYYRLSYAIDGDLVRLLFDGGCNFLVSLVVVATSFRYRNEWFGE